MSDFPDYLARILGSVAGQLLSWAIAPLPFNFRLILFLIVSVCICFAGAPITLEILQGVAASIHANFSGYFISACLNGILQVPLVMMVNKFLNDRFKPKE